jgi:hypothetical protein
MPGIFGFSVSAKPECITEAIENLYRVQTAAATNVLANYLDFQRSLPREDFHAPMFTRVYPAADVLFSIGKPALPALVQVVVRKESLSLARQNALHTLMLIYRDAPTGH